MKSLKSNRIYLLLTAIILTLILSACSFNGGKEVQNYVSGVNDNIHEAVNLTRKLREIQKDINTRNTDDAKSYNSLLSDLADVYSNLIELEPVESYNDIDREIKEHSQITLTAVSQLQSLITASINTNDDTLYCSECDEIMKKYDESYFRLVELDSETQTRFRNG